MSRAPQRQDGTDRLARRLHLMVRRFELALADDSSLMNVTPSALCTQLVTLGGRSRPASAANTVQDYGEHRTSQAEKSPENTTGNAEFQHLTPSESMALYPADHLVNDPPLHHQERNFSAKHSDQHAAPDPVPRASRAFRRRRPPPSHKSAGDQRCSEEEYHDPARDAPGPGHRDDRQGRQPVHEKQHRRPFMGLDIVPESSHLKTPLSQIDRSPPK